MVKQARTTRLFWLVACDATMDPRISIDVSGAFLRLFVFFVVFCVFFGMCVF